MADERDQEQIKSFGQTIVVPREWVKHFKNNPIKAMFLSYLWSLQIAEVRSDMAMADGSFFVFREILETELGVSQRSFFRYMKELERENIIKSVHHCGQKFTLINFTHSVFDAVRDIVKDIQVILEQKHKDFSKNNFLKIERVPNGHSIYNTSYYITLKYFVFIEFKAGTSNFKNPNKILKLHTVQNSLRQTPEIRRLNLRRKVRFALTNRKVISLINYWKQTLKLPSHKEESQSYLLAVKHLSNAIKNHGYENVKQSMNLYKELFDSRYGLNITQHIGYHVRLSEFFAFTPNTKKLLLQNGHLKGVDSWMEECLKGRDHAFNVFHGLPKDVNPGATSLIKEEYREQFPAMYKASYNNLEEKQFRFLTQRLRLLYKQNQGNWNLDGSSRPPIQKIVRLFFSYLSSKTLKRTDPGFLLLDWLHRDFDLWLYQNGYLTSRR